MSDPRPSQSDPTPEERKGDSSFLPVVIMAGIAIVVILVAALFIIKSHQNRIVPKASDTAHPTSQRVSPRLNPSIESESIFPA
jgi:sensor domain CHASE-containing protein